MNEKDRNQPYPRPDYLTLLETVRQGVDYLNKRTKYHWWLLICVSDHGMVYHVCYNGEYIYSADTLDEAVAYIDKCIDVLDTIDRIDKQA